MSDKDKWQSKLTPDQYAVLREKGTEQPFTGKLLRNKDKGEYACAACGNIVFDSQHKFDSNSGWPSFYQVADDKAVVLKKDDSQGMKRVEVTCAVCGSHLGHMFSDAPSTPTGTRFCINSVALDFKKEGQK